MKTAEMAEQNAVERRFELGGRVQIRKDENQKGPGTVFGRVAPYNARSKLLYGVFYEEIMPGAFGESIRDASVRGLLEHLGHATLGKNASGTLRLNDTPMGLEAELDLPDTTHGRDAAELIERGDISGWSFGFMDGKWDWFDLDDDTQLGRLKEARLFEVTLTANPAYPQTSAAMRSLESHRGLVVPEKKGPVLSEVDLMRLRTAEMEEAVRAQRRGGRTA